MLAFPQRNRLTAVHADLRLTERKASGGVRSAGARVTRRSPGFTGRYSQGVLFLDPLKRTREPVPPLAAPAACQVRMLQKCMLAVTLPWAKATMRSLQVNDRRRRLANKTPPYLTQTAPTSPFSTATRPFCIPGLRDYRLHLKDTTRPHLPNPSLTLALRVTLFPSDPLWPHSHLTFTPSAKHRALRRLL